MELVEQMLDQNPFLETEDDGPAFEYTSLERASTSQREEGDAPGSSVGEGGDEPAGMDGADFGLLDAIAAAGHSDCTPNVAGQEACNVTGGAQSFSDARALIRNTVTTTTTTTETQTIVQGTQLPCDFTIPEPPAGETFDRNKVNVQFVNGATSVATVTITVN